MATTTVTYPSDQHNNWATGISIPSGYYISSISFSCAGAYNESGSIPVTLYIGGVQIAVCQPGSHATFSGSATGKITSATITANYNYFSFRAPVTFTYTLTASQVSRTITRKVSPSGAGSITTKKNGSSVSSAYKNDTIDVAHSQNSGYVWKGWTTSPSGLIASGASSFKMPDQNVTVTGNYWKLSTGSLNKTSFDGGSTIKLTITAQNSSLAHRYRLYKDGVSGLTTGWVQVAAGTTTVNITVPLEWSQYNTSGTSISGLVLELRTYNGSDHLGTTQITGLTYNIPASVKPTIGTITTSVARTIDGVTYGNIGDIYAQNHCGVQVQTTASGAQNSTIATLKVEIGSYSGNKYNKTVSGGSIDFTSGLLSSPESCTIKVTATDSRGRTATKTATIIVSAYAKPSGSLRVWRVNSSGTTDEMGVYGKYELTKMYSAIGDNSLAWTLAVSGNSRSSPEDTGDLLPENRLELSDSQEYTVTLTLTDGLETTVITATIPSARFIMAFDATGNKIGIMKFPALPIPTGTGKKRTFEISDDTQVYLGPNKIEDFIKNTIKGSKSTVDDLIRDVIKSSISTVLNGLFVYKYYTKAIDSIANNATLSLTGDDFGVSTPSGYTPFAIKRFTSGSVHLYAALVRSDGTGTSTLMNIKNVSGSTQTDKTAGIGILYIKTGIVNNL